MLDLSKYKNKFKENEYETLIKIQEVAKLLYKDIKRKDNKTEYFVHPEAVVQILLDAEVYDLIVLSVAYLHDVLEENTSITSVSALKLFLSYYVSDEELLESIVDKVDMLTFNEYFYSEEAIPYMKAMYLSEIVKLSYKYPEILLVKLADRFANILDFYNSNSKSYAKKYFTRAEILFGAAYQFQSDFSDHYQNLLEMENKTDGMCELIEYNLKYMFYFNHLINKLKEVKQTIYQK
jgi:(p)ppGpp synthase/HD superfamily hydrolase